MTSGCCGGNRRRGCGDQGGTARFELVRVALVSLILFLALWHHQELLNILRFSTSFLVLLFPTTAMGLTLPVLLEDPFLHRRQFGCVIAAFYGFNTLGGVAGALLGEGYLMRRFGLPGTGLTAACLSFAAAGIAWLFAGTEPTG